MMEIVYVYRPTKRKTECVVKGDVKGRIGEYRHGFSKGVGGIIVA